MGADRRQRRKEIKRRITKLFQELCDLSRKPVAVLAIGTAGAWAGPLFVGDGSIRLGDLDDLLERVRQRTPHEPTPLDAFLEPVDGAASPSPDVLHAVLQFIVKRSHDPLYAVLDLARVIKRVALGVPDPGSVDMIREAIADLSRQFEPASEPLPPPGPSDGCGGPGDGVLAPCPHRRRTRNDLAPSHRAVLDILESLARKTATETSTPEEVADAVVLVAETLTRAHDSADADLVGPIALEVLKDLGRWMERANGDAPSGSRS